MRDGVGIHCSRVLNIDPAVGGTIASFTIHSRRDENPLALIAFSPNQMSLLQLVEEAADCYARGPRILGLNLLDDFEILACLQVLGGYFMPRVVGNFLRHFL